VILIDSDMSDEALLARSADLQVQYPSAQMVLLVKEANQHAESLAARIGAVGVLTRGVGRSGLVNSLCAAAAGQALPKPTRLAEGIRAQENLTSRELAVLGLLAAGRTNGEIATELAISPNTVRTHVQNILSKLGARGRHNAVNLARRAGLLPRVPPPSRLCS
jgi:DNA-binding NarL/FixJ family response regulator